MNSKRIIMVVIWSIIGLVLVYFAGKTVDVSQEYTGNIPVTFTVTQGQTLSLTEVVSFTALSDSYFILTGDKGGVVESRYIWSEGSPEDGRHYVQTGPLVPQSWYVAVGGSVEIQSTEAGIKGTVSYTKATVIFDYGSIYILLGAMWLLVLRQILKHKFAGA